MARTISARKTWLRAVAGIDFLALNDTRLTTVGDFLRRLGIPADVIRRYSSQVGIRASKAARAAGVRPGRVLVLVTHRYRASFRKAQLAYSPAQLPLLAEVVRDYPRTAPFTTVALAA